jgi:hypothetical protein
MADELERHYECPRCGMRAVVVVEAEASRSPWRRTEERLGADGLARQDDATSALGLARCPSCHERPAGALLWSSLRVVTYSIGAIVAYGLIGVVIGGRMRFRSLTMLFEYAPVIFGVAGVVATMIEIRRWGAAGKMRVIQELRAPIEKTLPRAQARVVTAPPVAAEKKPAAVEKSAPPPVIEPASPDEGPRFLKP